MKAVVGLSNPGPEFVGTRHNIGSEVVETFLDSHGERLGKGPSRTRCQTGELRLGAGRVVAAVPLTYMNESGRPVRALLDYFDILPTEMLVVHDDIDLPFGRLRIQHGGGNGGHNGLRSIDGAVGGDYSRLKLGVGRPPGGMDPASYVLSRFAKAERAEVEWMTVDAAAVVTAWITDPESATRQAGERKLG